MSFSEDSNLNYLEALLAQVPPVVAKHIRTHPEAEMLAKTYLALTPRSQADCVDFFENGTPEEKKGIIDWVTHHIIPSPEELARWYRV